MAAKDWVKKLRMKTKRKEEKLLKKPKHEYDQPIHTLH